MRRRARRASRGSRSSVTRTSVRSALDLARVHACSLVVGERMPRPTPCAASVVVRQHCRAGPTHVAGARRDTAGQVERALPVPVGDEPRHLERLRPRERGAELARDDVPDDPLPKRGAGSPRARATDTAMPASACSQMSSIGLVDQLVERLGVLAQLLGGAGERLGDARARARPRARAAPCSRTRTRANAGVDVVRVVPRLEALRRGRPAAVVARRMPRSGRA